MAITAFPYTAVLDVSANSLLGNNTGSPTAAIALTATQVRTLLSVYTSAQVDSLLAGYQPLDADLTAIAALTTTTFGRSLLTQADAAAARTTIGAGTSSFSGAYGDLSGIPATFAPSAHKTSHATGGSDALTAADIGAVPTARTLTINGTTQDLSADRSFTVSAGVSGSTGSVDNAMLRADGTGGSTVQASDWLMADNYTASPNNTVNHASLQATGSTTNVSVSIVPKGSGSFSLHVPDGTSTGGNARGANAVDLQTLRTAASQVASGVSSFLSPGLRNVASGTYTAVCGGALNTASGDQSAIVAGESNTASAQFSCVIAGWFSEATSQYALSTGIYARARLRGMVAHSSDPCNLAGVGRNQSALVHMGTKTTDATPKNLWVNRDQSERFTIPSGFVIRCSISVVGIKSDGSAVAIYERRVAIKNVGGTTSLVGSVQTIGTDHEDNASTDVAITADDTNDALQIAVTGIASETWRWYADISAIELQYGS